VSNGHRMTTGFLGTYPLLPVLSANGRHDLAVRLFQSREFPSWGYEVENGATTIWERWNSYTREKGFFEPSMNSFSHYSFGAVAEWMFRSLAGIDTDGPGYRKIVIRPGPVAGRANPGKPVEWVKAEYVSVRGRIVVNWRVAGGRFELETTIPANTTARVGIPTGKKDEVTWHEVGSGSHRFTAPR
jgi:alpha-L-rhamnosidase